MKDDSRIIPVALESGETIYISAKVLDPEQDVAHSIPSLNELWKKIDPLVEEIGINISKNVSKLNPSKFGIEFGVDIGIESGSLTALVAKGVGSASIKISLEWQK